MTYIALDLGGTKIAGALFDKNGHVLEREVTRLAGRSGNAVGALLVDQAQRLLEESHAKNLEVTAIGISVPGIYYSDTGRVWAPNIAGWDKFPLLDTFLGHPEFKNLLIRIDSDRACYILGEAWQGNAQGCTDAIFMAVGTGIGAGILIDKKILRGTHDIAGAIGWLALDRPFHEKFVSCGCYEYHASGDGIARVAREILEQDQSYQGALRQSNINELTSYAVFKAFSEGDPLAARVLDIAVEFWGMAAANLVSLFNPQKIIFGGGVFGPAAEFIGRIYTEAKKWAQPISIQEVSFEVSALGDNAGLYGAGRLAMIDDI